MARRPGSGGGFLTDVEARAQRRRTRTRDEMWHGLVVHAMGRAEAAADPVEALRWLERAHRLLPHDGTVALSLAGGRLTVGDLAGARVLFAREAGRQGTLEAWAGAAAAARLMGDAAGARAALAAALRCGAPAEVGELADQVAGPGEWCGLTAEGVVVTAASPVLVTLDGARVGVRRVKGGYRLPEGWRQGAELVVSGPGGALLGSPLPVRRFGGVEGFVEAEAGGLAGWAWVTGDPGSLPRLRVEGRDGAFGVVMGDADRAVLAAQPLARPRRFMVPRAAVEAVAGGGAVSVLGPDGRHVLGSPLDPGLEGRAAGVQGRAGFAPAWVDAMGGPPAVSDDRPGVDVVVPVYRGVAETVACLESVLVSLPKGARLVVSEDASPEAELVAAVEQIGRSPRVVVVRSGVNRGFPGAANAGMAVAADARGGRDVVLLNSDTLVPPGWLERLRAAAYSAPEIGTVTPLSNDAGVTGYPDPDRGNRVPDLGATVALDRLAQGNGAGVVELPVGVGFCLYIRRDCLDQVGGLREDLFAQGYGEENDFCLRARQLGWRSVAAPGVFVAHVGATSFGAARAHLVRRNTAVLERLHPGYGALVERHLALDPLRAVRRQMDEIRWGTGRQRAGAMVLVTHGGGGGVERVVQERAMRAAGSGLRAILLRPQGGGVAVSEVGDGDGFPNLVFAMPGEMGALVRLLRRDRVGVVEQHHMLGHHADIGGLAAALGAALVVVVHDYAQFCPRIALVSTERRYCGEPDLAGCEACIADLGSLLEDDPPVRVLVARSAAVLGAASRVVVPSMDAGVRIGRHFPGVRAEVEAWEADVGYPAIRAGAGAVCRVVVVGAIGVEKGYEVLLGCVRDARGRGLPLEFVVVGFTADDERLMEAGPAFVTGEYQEEDAVGLIEAQGGHLALIPSVWPETWCFALSRAWEAGLGAAVFDLGAQAERVRATGRGWVLPLGLPCRGINDWLLRLARGAGASHSPARLGPQINHNG